MPTIFISYRREDSLPYAGRLYDRMIAQFGKERVFMDIDTIRPGEDFVEILNGKVGACDVLIALIGRNWLASKDVDGNRRLDSPEDFVRLEILTAINRKIRIIPVLVGGGDMPRVHELPEALRALARRQAVEISDLRFHQDVSLLIESLEKNVEVKGHPPTLSAGVQVTMTYDLELDDGTERRTIPFVIGVLADLTGSLEQPLPRLKDPIRRFVEITATNFHDVLKATRPRLCVEIPNRLTSDNLKLTVELKFSHLNDFEPAQVVQQIEPLRTLLQERKALSSLRASYSDRLGEVLGEILRDPDSLRRVIEELNGGADRSAILAQLAKQVGASDDYEEELVKGWLAQFFRYTVADTLSKTDSMESILSSRIQKIDDVISIQLDEVMHEPAFQRLEATWRGLHYLVAHIGDSPHLKIRVLNVSKADLGKDLEKAVEFDQSAIFKKVYEDEYGTSGGEPFSVLIGDYEFGRHPMEISMLEQISNVAAASHVPFIAGAGPAMFGIRDFQELEAVRDLYARFSADMYGKWRSFRDSEDSRYVGLVVPRILLRGPYHKGSDGGHEFQYHEAMGTTGSHEKYLWGNSAFAFGAAVMSAFARYGWCAALQDNQGDMLTENLPARAVLTKNGKTTVHCSTEITVEEPRRDELIALGIIPLCNMAGGKATGFVNIPSCRKPRLSRTKEQNLKASLSVQLVSVLAVSRIAHYLKAILRYKASRFMSVAEIQVYLNEWISAYVDAGDDRGEQVLRRLPFKKSSVKVEQQGWRYWSHDSYLVQATLQAQFQFSNLSTEMESTLEQPKLSSTDDMVIKFSVEK